MSNNEHENYLNAVREIEEASDDEAANAAAAGLPPMPHAPVHHPPQARGRGRGRIRRRPYRGG